MDVLGCRILEYPFLQLGTNMKSIAINLEKNEFKLVSSRGDTVYKKANDFTIITVIANQNEISRISIQLNVDIE